MALTAAEHEAAIATLEAKILTYLQPDQADLGRSFTFSSIIREMRAEIDRHKEAIRELDGVVDLSVQVYP